MKEAASYVQHWCRVGKYIIRTDYIPWLENSRALLLVIWLTGSLRLRRTDSLGLDLHNSFNFHGHIQGQGTSSNSRSGMISHWLAENLHDNIRTSVQNQVLLFKVVCRLHDSKHLDNVLFYCPNPPGTCILNTITIASLDVRELSYSFLMKTSQRTQCSNVTGVPPLRFMLGPILRRVTGTTALWSNTTLLSGAN